ncbi:Vps54-like protein-domain-containing protein [Phlyctochytrium arcticum]|nr:Vps54-like protein-domain-containing protein [Phlyctochytrium arcticum]
MDNLASLKRHTIPENPIEDATQDEHVWTTRDIGTNAISGILNDPHDLPKSGQKGINFKTMESVTPVTPLQIRKIQTNEFDPYVKTLAEVYGKYQLNRALGLANATEGTPMLSHNDQPSPSYANLEEISTRLGVASTSRSGKGSKSGANRQSAGQINRNMAANAAALETVPAIFLEPEFNLSNPHTFAQVCNNLDITSGVSTESATANANLQDKLSGYLDTVEVHLIKEISRRSTSFFAALANLQALHNETQTCVSQIKGLRQKLGSLSDTTAKKGLEVVRLKRRRGNLGMLYGGVRLVTEIRQSQPMIQSVLESGDFVAALDMIEHANTILRGVGGTGSLAGPATEQATLTDGVKLLRSTSVISQSFDLRRVKSLTAFNAQLGQLSRTIGMMMESELSKIMLNDISEHIALTDARQLAPKVRDAPSGPWVRDILGSKYTLSTTSPLGPTPDIGLSASEERLKTRLTPMLLGLLRTDRLGGALQLYKELLLKEVKNLSKKYYPQLQELSMGASPMAASPMTPGSEAGQQQSALARQLRIIAFDSFFELLSLVYITLLHILQRVATIHQLIVMIIKEAQERGVIIGADSGKLENMSPQHPISKLKKKNSEEEDEFGSTATLELDDDVKAEESPAVTTASDVTEDGSTLSTFGQMISESSDVLFSASDLAHVRCAKLLGVRSEQNAQLNPPQFFQLFGATWEFVVGGEALCGRMCFGLKGTLLSQAKAFINRFHEEKHKQLAHIVENEKWSQADIPVEFQRLIDEFFGDRSLRAGSHLASSDESLHKSESSKSAEDDGDLGIAGVSTSNAGSNSDIKAAAGDGKLRRCLTIDDKKFNVVECVLTFIKMLTEYLQCMEQIPALTTDVLNRIADILKLFNSRTCQVILGAGAMRSAGLKNISAKHIALAAQALGAIVAIIPHLKDHLSKHLPVKQKILLGDFDRLLRDYRDHQSELYGKLLSIMEEFCLAQTERLKNLHWDQPQPGQFNDQEGASTYTQDLVKQTVTLHKVLARYLPSDVMKTVMADVYKKYNTTLGDQLKNVDFYSGAGKNRMLMDVQYLIAKLSALDGVDGPGNHLEVVVNNVKIKDKRAVLAQQQLNQNQQSQQQQQQFAPGRSGSIDAGRPLQTTPTSGTPSQSSTSAAQQKKTNFASAFGNMLKTKNSNLPGGG